MSRWVALVNARAGGGRAIRVYEDLARAEPRLAAAELLAPQSREEAAAALAERAAAGAERVLVFGGDGSVQLAGNAILAAGAGERTAIAIIPAGTGSDLARNLLLPREPAAALARALEGTPRPIDALDLATPDGRRRWVLNVASAGISGLVDEAVNAMPTKGHTGYMRATLAALARYRPVPCRVTLDGEPFYEGRILVLAIANSKTFGNGMKIAPDAELDDGEADVVLIGDLPRWEIPLRLPQIYSGGHLKSRHTLSRRARRVRVEPLAAWPPLDLDGETFAAPAGMEIDVRPRAIRLVS